MSEKRYLSITRRQSNYLHELVTDDLEETVLTDEERSAAQAVLRRIESSWGPPPPTLESVVDALFTTEGD